MSSQNVSSHAEINQVQQVCPHVEISVIASYLNITGSVERTINRLLDRMTSQESVMPLTVESSDDEDALPSLGAMLKSSRNHTTLGDNSAHISVAGHTTDGSTKSSTVTTKGKYCFKKTSTSYGHSKDNCLSTDTKRTSTMNTGLDNPSSYRSKVTSRCISADSDPEIECEEEGASDRLSKSREQSKITGVDFPSNPASLGGQLVCLSSDEEDSEILVKPPAKRKCEVISSRQVDGSIKPLTSISDNLSSTKKFAEQLKMKSFNTVGAKHISNSAAVARVPSLDTDGSDVTMDSQESFGSVVSVNSGKKQRTAEEINQQKRLAQEKRREKERQKMEKDLRRGKLMEEKEQKRKQKELERMTKKTQQEQMRSLRPGECLKYMVLVMDQQMFASPLAQPISAAFQGSEVRCCYEQQPISNSVTWRRRKVESRLGDDTQFGSVCEDTEDYLSVILPADHFAQLIDNYKQEKCSQLGRETLRSFVENTKDLTKIQNITIVVQSIEQYFRDQSTSLKRSHREAVLGGPSKAKGKASKKGYHNCVSVSRVEIEEVLVDLQLFCDAPVRMIETPEGVASFLFNMTKAVAEKPFKQDRHLSAFSFHVETGGVKPDKEGRGLIKVWRQQLQQFKNVSPEIANTILAVYPSPLALIQAYTICSSEKDKEKLLADKMVRRGTGVLETSRRIGKELSRRIYQLMTSTDPQLIIK